MAQKTIDFENDILGPIGSLKEDLAYLKDNKITKFYTNNNGDTVLNDSDDGKIQDLVIHGKSEQAQYTGKNLLNYEKWKTTRITHGTAVYENNGITITAISDDAYTQSTSEGARISVTAGKTYILSWEEETNLHGIVSVFPNGSVSGSVNSDNAQAKRVIFTASSNTNFVTFRFGVATAGKTISYKNIMYEEGSERTDYEPYTGGKPSPSPEYPQEIKAVANPMMKVCGKNIAQKIVYGYINQNNSVQIDNMSVSCVAYLVKDNTYTVSSKVKMDRLKIGRIDESDLESLSGAQCEVFINDISTSAEKNFKSPFTGYAFIYLNTSKNDTIVSSLQVEFGSTATSYQPYTEQTATLPYTLNAIPVSSGGNVTIDGQQYIADYVDVERGKLVRMTELIEYDGTENWSLQSINNNGIANFQIIVTRYIGSIGMCDTLQLQKTTISNTNTEGFMINNNNSLFIRINTTRGISTLETFKEFLANKHIFILYALSTPTEIDLVKEEITAFKALSTYYPKTYINAESEQLEAYTMFNYPVSMEKGWEYVKQQIGDTRKYVYDMDLQSAEAYVNSEYAVALTELEV